MSESPTTEISDEPMRPSVQVTNIRIINGVLWADAIETGQIIGAMKGKFSLDVGHPYAEAVLEYIERKRNDR